MKKIFTIICLLFSLTMSAVTVNEVTGTFKGTLLIDDEQYPNEKIIILPGSESNAITFVLPDFKFNGAPLGDIVLVNVPMSTSGELTIEENTLYIRSIKARASISSTGSTLSSSSAQIGLSIEVAAVPMPIPVTFTGSKVTNDNYAITNGGFEGNWSNNEPKGWHSFVSATGSYASFVTGNTAQFQQSTDTRPGSTGSHSALVQSKVTMGVKANGNCTNGRINAGSMSATDASGNYAFSEPGSSYSTPFVGQPDSLVFWAKYIPGGGSVEDASNQARAHATLLTNARYQDPESCDYSAVKIAEAASNYSATTGKGWQRISVPFVYTSVDPSQMAYMLITFTTNKTPGGGNSSKDNPDKVYIDDAEMVYNHSLTKLTLDGSVISFTSGQAVVDKLYSDSEYAVSATTNGKASKSFIGYDAANYRIYLYVVADNFAQARAYSLYTIQLTAPKPADTEYAYEASICDNETYSDELFQNLTQAGTYIDTIPNSAGGDSVVTFTLHVLPTYRMDEKMYLNEVDIVWHEQAINNLPQREEPYLFYDSLKTDAGCDSVYVLTLFVSEIPVTYGAYEARMCEGESVEYEGVEYSEAFEGDVRVAQLNQYGGDSIVHLTVRVMPNYTIDAFMTIEHGEEASWEGWDLSGLPEGEMELNAWYYSIDDCDSTIVLHLTVLPKQIGTGIPATQWNEGHAAYKVLLNGRIYIIRKEDETMYDIVGNKIQ